MMDMLLPADVATLECGLHTLQNAPYQLLALRPRMNEALDLLNQVTSSDSLGHDGCGY